MSRIAAQGATSHLVCGRAMLAATRARRRRIAFRRARRVAIAAWSVACANRSSGDSRDSNRRAPR